MRYTAITPSTTRLLSIDLLLTLAQLIYIILQFAHTLHQHDHTTTLLGLHSASYNRNSDDDDSDDEEADGERLKRDYTTPLLEIEADRLWKELRYGTSILEPTIQRSGAGDGALRAMEEGTGSR